MSLKKNTDMGHGFFANQFFVHVGLKSQGLHIFVLADFDKLLSTLIA